MKIDEINCNHKMREDNIIKVVIPKGIAKIIKQGKCNVYKI